MSSFKGLLYILFAMPVMAPATVSAPVAISSVSRASSVVTVTCATACGIAANQGFSIAGVTDGSFNLNGTATAGSGTSFTFNQAGANASSSGGTVTPAKTVIITTVFNVPTGLQVNATLSSLRMDPLVIPLQSATSRNTDCAAKSFSLPATSAINGPLRSG